MVQCVARYDVPAIIITSSKVKSVDRAYLSITDSLTSLGYSLPQENQARKVEDHEPDAQTTYSYSNPNGHKIDFIDKATRLFAKHVETNRDNSDCYGREYMQDFKAYLLIPSSKPPSST